MKPGNLIIKWLLLSSIPHAVLKDYPRHLTKYEDKGLEKSQSFIFFMNLELKKSGIIHSPRPTFRNPNFKCMDELRKAMSEFKIFFPKMLRIYHWIGKSIFHWGKRLEPITNSTHTIEFFGQKALKIYISSLYISLWN